MSVIFADNKGMRKPNTAEYTEIKDKSQLKEVDEVEKAENTPKRGRSRK